MSCPNPTPSFPNTSTFDRKPKWLKMQPVTSQKFYQLKKNLKLKGLVTVCEEAKCPNITECWSQGTATMMLLGDTCTRFCKFCNIKTGNPNGYVDPNEPTRVAKQIADSQLKYVVLTCVDRDDLPDGGADVFKKTLLQIKKLAPNIHTEVLVSDYAGNHQSLRTVLNGYPDVLAHNIETVEPLSHIVRDRRASYKQSLTLLNRAKKFDPKKITKSSLMVGFGETRKEIEKTCTDLRNVGVDIITFGQYLRPSPNHISVKRYYHPQEFVELENVARKLGFLFVASAPLARSSYRASELFMLGFLNSQKLTPTS